MSTIPPPLLTGNILTYGGVGSDSQLLSLDRRVGGYGDRVDFSMVRRLCCKHRTTSEY